MTDLNKDLKIVDNRSYFTRLIYLVSYLPNADIEEATICSFSFTHEYICTWVFALSFSTDIFPKDGGKYLHQSASRGEQFTLTVSLVQKSSQFEYDSVIINF